jgi:hypothetical protein
MDRTDEGGYLWPLQGVLGVPALPVDAAYRCGADAGVPALWPDDGGDWGMKGGGVNRDELVEKLAEVEHQRWADWQKYLHGKCETMQPLGYEIKAIPFHSWHHWERQIATPYSDLSEQEKQSDREQVARYWSLIVAFVADWLAASVADYPDDVVGLWCEEMGR